MPDLTKEQLYIILGIIAVILIGCVVGIFNQNVSEKRSSPESSPQSVLIENKAKIEPVSSYIHVSGAVEREGLYKMKKGDRLVDLLKLCGVDTAADLDSVNLAEPISDGQKVIIPKKAGNNTVNMRMSSSANKTGKANKIVNINAADEKQLDSLPGIGPAMAKKIFDYRSEKGRFSNIEELKEVPGISEKKFEKLKALISVY